MLSEEQITALRQKVASVIADELTRANIDWASFDQLAEPSVCIKAEFQDRSVDDSSVEQRPLPGLTISKVIDLTKVTTPRSSASPALGGNSIGVAENQNVEPTSGTIVPLSRNHTPIASHDAPNQVSGDKGKHSMVNENSNTSDGEDNGNNSRMAISGLRPSRGGIPVVEDNTQRQMQVVNENFPKRRKAEAVGYTMKPSSLDKLVIGIWEQLHSGVSVDPVHILGEFMTPPLLRDAISPSQDIAGLSLSSSGPSSASPPDRHFNETTVLCRKVTQASRTCRSIEVIVQARWVEHFDAYVEHLKANDPKISVTRHRKTVSAESSSNFGWSEKELRNKMAIWRGYKEIKDAGGWASLVFAGMGIYRFCKYRIGFDNESMQRLRNLRPALEVAADTMNQNWRRLLSIVGEPPERMYSGHPHDWVICLDGSPPIQLRKTYLQWDPHFEYKHIDESVIDQAAWGYDDPRWKPPSSEALTRISSLFVCQDCLNEQSDEPKLNCCYCFPSLFGCATFTPPPVQVFRTPNGRNNGLMALCAFERGAAVGEFIGVITKGLQDVDVMENATGSAKYQIWQGRQGNFTRFVNHSCNSNSQYQQFTWLDTQRIVLVSKGIGAGSEITVDYSDKYWKGLDKKCLCGEKSSHRKGDYY
ncbi:hypothetical protein E0Z10_g8294 [Xylaria hypoxylon]|uniref:SET domain-containing protein n=1 Tax=Xylaria hypoxylon TaxID=37992 RepID=A0A4Z0YK45_9PEZI|nr:hypothetical protein E0Z10_g8294 [Xylaria hypoxylon]